MRARLAHPAAPWIVLAAGMAASGLFLAHHMEGLGVFGDDYNFLLNRRGYSLDTLLKPHNEHLSVAPLIVYKVLFAFFGLSTSAPYYAILLITLFVCAALLYVLVRPGLGPWLGLAPPALVLTLGPAGELLLWPFEFTILGAIAFSLAGLIAIGHDGRRADLLAAGALTMSVCFSTVGVLLLPACAAAILVRDRTRDGLRRLWVVAVPLVLWLAWYAHYRPESQRDFSLIPDFMWESLKATVQALTSIDDPTLATPLAVVTILLVARGFAVRRPLPWRAVAFLVGLVVIWAVVALNSGPGRPPEQSRYQFENVLLLLGLFAALAPPWLKRPVPAAALGFFVAWAALANAGRLEAFRQGLAGTQAIANASLVALEVARPNVADASEVVLVGGEPGVLSPFQSQSYYRAIDDHGSPVDLKRHLLDASPPAKAQADIVLGRAIELHFEPGSGRRGATTPTAASGAPLAAAGRGCGIAFAGGAQVTAFVQVPPGGIAILTDPGPPVALSLGRYSPDSAPYALGLMGGDVPALVRIPADKSPLPWRMAITGSQRVRVCSLAE